MLLPMQIAYHYAFDTATGLVSTPQFPPQYEEGDWTKVDLA